jgi:hypothetical protein
LLVDHRKSWRADGGGPLSAPWIDLSGISTQRSIVLKTTKGVVNATCVGLERQFREVALGFVRVMSAFGAAMFKSAIVWLVAWIIKAVGTVLPALATDICESSSKTGDVCICKLSELRRSRQ